MDQVFVNWSGGKDAALSLYRLLGSGTRKVGTLVTTVTAPVGRVSMHGVREELLRAQASSLGIPLRVVYLPEHCSLETYDARMASEMNFLNIDHTQLIAIMHDFEQALNYRCGDCHYADPSNPRHIDFASDANPKKDVARHMMKMMMRINKKFFNKKGDFAANYVDAKYEVTCYTCHHGSEHPLKFSDKPQKEEHRMPPPPPAPAQ